MADRKIKRLPDGAVLVAGAVLLLAAGALRGQIVVNHIHAGKDPADKKAPKAVPLVAVMDDLVDSLDKAHAYLQQHDYARAIEILQALVTRGETGFWSDPNGRRFVSLRQKVQDEIGQMDADGLKMYRTLYDPQAQHLYEQAMATGDETVLHQIATSYLHTAWGPRALDSLGAIHFDAGRFTPAARCWQQVLQYGPPEASEAPCLAKIAIAYHLAGDEAASRAALGALAQKQPEATVTFGGAQRNALAYAQEVCKLAPATAPALAATGWKGLGGYADGRSVMEDANVSLGPQWVFPPSAGDSNISLIALKSAGIVPEGRGGQFKLVRRSGQAQLLRLGPSTNRMKPMPLPSCLQPVVVGQTVVYRCDSGIVGCDIVTGEQVWSTADLPLERQLKSIGYEGSGWSGPYGGIGPADCGRYTLTVGDGKVFALANFRPAVPDGMATGAPGDPAVAKEMNDSSDLVALSVAGQLKRLWRQGNGIGDADVLANGKFLCAPAYDSGRLYVIATYMDNYHLLCLNSQTGALVWKAQVSQTPPPTGNYGSMSVNSLLRGSPPAVADGRVFAMTNGGIVAAFDAQTGAALWAYQYDSPFGRGTGNDGSFPRLFPPNPVIVSQNRLICLPADSEKLIALSPEDGSVAWEADRAGLSDLAVVDAQRVALSGPGLAIVQTADGNRVANLTTGDIADISGRPAVTPSAILAAGQGRLWRIDLGDYSHSQVPLEDPTGLLGNLVTAGGGIIAANACGLCGYMEYPQARANLLQRMAAAATDDRAGLYLRLGCQAFKAKDYSKALDALQSAQEAPGNNPELRKKVQPWLCRTLVALGNQTPGGAKMQEFFRQAFDLAATASEKAQVKLQIAKGYRLAAEAAAEGPSQQEAVRAAVAEAQGLIEQFSSQSVADVPVGPAAEAKNAEIPSAVPARLFAKQFIDECLWRYGRAAYVNLDANARAALDASRAAGDPNGLLEVAAQWPNSVWCDEAKFIAAEMLYRGASASPRSGAGGLLSRTMELLAPLAADAADAQMRISANCVLAMLWDRAGRRAASQFCADRAMELAAAETSPGDVDIAFGDIAGKLPQVLDSRAGDAAVSAAAPEPWSGGLSLPLAPLYTFGDEATMIIRDYAGSPLRLGQRLLVLSGTRLSFLDPAASSGRPGEWEALFLDQPNAPIVSPRGKPVRPVGGLSKDERTLVLADTGGIRAYDLRSAKIKWCKDCSKIGIGEPTSIGIAQDVIVLAALGKISCIAVETGELLWNATVDETGEPAGGMQQPATGQPIRRLQFGPGVVVIAHNAGRSATCLSLATGKILKRWDASRATGALFTSGGLLVVTTDNTTGAWDVADWKKPLWTHTSGPPADLLAVSDDWAAVRLYESEFMEVLSMATGEPLKLNNPALESQQGPQRMGMTAQFDGNFLIVACPVVSGAPSLVQTPAVECFDLVAKKLAWQWQDDPGEHGMYLQGPVLVGGGNVVIAPLPINQQDWTVHVFDRCKGGKVQSFVIPLPTPEDSPTGRPRKPFNATAPVLAAGRLCVETPQGVCVYGKP